MHIISSTPSAPGAAGSVGLTVGLTKLITNTDDLLERLNDIRFIVGG